MSMIPDLDLSLLKTFAAIVDEGGLTAAGKVVGRTQPAVTHQLRRLERLVGHKLLVVGRRQVALTHDGEILLQYARNILRLNDEARAHISGTGIEGRVAFGVPDLYASILPDILRAFGHAYPRIEIELRLTRSVHLHAALKRKEVDLALVSRLPGVEGGRFVGHMPLVWVSGMRDHPETIDPLPLAILPAGSIARNIVVEALEKFGRPWHIVSVSDSFAGLHAAVASGLAVSVIPQCEVLPDMRVLRASDRVPMLRPTELVIHHRAGPISPAAANLAEFIAQQLDASSDVRRRRNAVRKARR
jgi:DNA-binding transcriptional LysR family regulator